MESWVRVVCVSVGLILSFVATVERVEAQSEAELEQARARFAEGVSLAEAERWGEAAERFREVLEVRDTAAVRLNLAIALEHTGELTEAVELLRTVVEDTSLDRRTRREAQRLLAATEPRLGQLTIRLTGDEGGVEVRLDGRTIGLEQVGPPIAVDPGSREVVVRRAGAVLDSRMVQVEEGGSAEVTLRAAPIGPDPELLSVGAPGESDGGGGLAEDPWFWALLVGSVVLVGAAIAIGFVAGSPQASPLDGSLQPGFIEVRLP